MAKKKKRLTRDETWFVLFLIISFLVSGGIALLVSFIGGGFNLTLFLILFFTVLVFSCAINIVLRIPAVRGRIGEARVNFTLKGLTKKHGGSFIHNVIVSGEDGKTSQIDHVYVCTKGVFVIETKNYAGRIYGNDDQKQWTQVLAYGHSKHKLYNPVNQNWTHIRRLQEALPEKLDMVNVVVFVHGNIDFIESDSVYSLGGLKKLVAEKGEVYSSDKVTSIATAIQAYKDKPAATAKQHVEAIKATQQAIKEGICPRCGGKLVLRTSKKDGNQFYGCENFPKCRFTKRVEE